MKNKKITWTLISIAAILLLAVSVFAHNSENTVETQESFHEQMKSIMEDGNYEDFLSFREAVGFDIMPMITDEESFESMQERHGMKEQFHEENGFEMGQGMHGMMKGMQGHGKNHDNMEMHDGSGMQEGCPMMS